MPERCMCGDTECPSCGPAQGYNPPERDEDDLYEEWKSWRLEVDEE